MQVPQIEEDKPQEGEKTDAMTTSMEGIEDIPSEEKPAEASPAEGASHRHLCLFGALFAEAPAETPKAEEPPAEEKAEVAVEEEEIEVEEVKEEKPAGRQTIYLNMLSWKLCCRGSADDRGGGTASRRATSQIHTRLS